MRGKWGDCISFMLFCFAFVGIFISLELLLKNIFALINPKRTLALRPFLSDGSALILLAVRLILLFTILLPELFVIRRTFIDISHDRDFIRSQRYIRSNGYLQKKSILCTLVFSMLRFFAAVPAMLGAFGIRYFANRTSSRELTSLDLIGFMFSIGFTIVRLGLFFRYCISIAFAPYIMTLNPKANVFDACHLSVRLMDGRHGRYISFLFSFFKFVPLLVLGFPAVVIIPYYITSKIVFVKEQMNNYWQDKLPALIQRWEKYAR